MSEKMEEGSALIKIGDGHSIIHGKGIQPCSECSFIADSLCDFPIGEGKTCDMALCDDHAHPIGPDRHLCPIHAAMFNREGGEAPIKMKRIELFTGP